jgi:hypothetical protein
MAFGPDQEFCGQGKDEVAALELQYVPFTHPVQTVEPDVPVYVPNSQGLHNPPLAPKYPGTQMHIELALLPSSDMENAGQLVQAVVPFVPLENVPGGHRVHPYELLLFLNVPAAHGAQVPPTTPAKPRLQEQLVRSGLPSGDDENEGQAWHAVEAETLEKVPAGQERQAAEPLLALYVPETQLRQILLLVSF